MVTEPAPRDPDHPVAAERELRVADPVALERRPVAMVLPAVQLDDQARLGPKRIDFMAGDEGVDQRKRQIVVAAEVDQVALEIRPRPIAGQVEPQRQVEVLEPVVPR